MDLVGAPRRGEKERTPPMTVGMRQAAMKNLLQDPQAVTSYEFKLYPGCNSVVFDSYINRCNLTKDVSDENLSYAFGVIITFICYAIVYV